jgi:hypothetical protein
MSISQNIKEWINEVRVGLPFKEDSIVIRKVDSDQTQILLLSQVCCSPKILISKDPASIRKEDILAVEGLINHTH